MTRSGKKTVLGIIRLRKEMGGVNVPREKKPGTSPWLVTRRGMSRGSLVSGDLRVGWRNHWRL